MFHLIASLVLAAQPVTCDEYLDTQWRAEVLAGEARPTGLRLETPHCPAALFAQPTPGYPPGDLRCDPAYQRRTHYEYFADDEPNCPGLRRPRHLPSQRHHVSNAYWADVCLETDNPDECERQGEAGANDRVMTLEDVCATGATRFTDEHDVSIDCPDEPR